jgi:ATP-binding cassette subfamily C protein
MLTATVTDSVSILLLLPFLSLLGQNAGSNEISLHIPLTGLPVANLHISLIELLSLFVLVVMASTYMNRVKSVLMADMLLDILNMLRADLFKAIANARWSFISSHRLADFDHALTGDIDRVQAAMTNLLLFVQNSILVLVLIGLSCIISVYVTVLVCLLGGLLLLFMAPFRAKASVFGESATRERKRQYRTTSDFLLGLKVAKSFNAQDEYHHQFVGALQNLKRHIVSFARLNSSAGFLFQTLTAVAACTFIYASVNVFALEPSRIVALVVIFSRVSPRMSALQGYLQAFATNFPAYANMQHTHMKAVKACESSGSRSQTPPTFQSSIELRGVFFSYGDREVLNGLNLTVKQQTVTAIMGPSGSGKSTIADLLLGLQFPSQGEILIDGVPLANIDLALWRARHVSYVQQETFLFAGSLADNLRLADATASDEKIWQALRMASAGLFVEALPMGIETLVGDGAIALSGGERQRLSIARAILRHPSLLILDEATSGLDAVNTSVIVDLVRRLRQDMAVLIITHEESVAAVADQIVRLGGIDA